MSQTPHTIRYASGSTSQHEDYQSAIAEIISGYPDAYTHKCDTDANESRTLVWVNEADSEADDGSNAIAEIIEEHDA